MLRLTYSTTVSCSSTGKVKITGSSGALDSAADRPVGEIWDMVSRLGVVVARPAFACDMVRRSRRDSCECGEVQKRKSRSLLTEKMRELRRLRAVSCGMHERSAARMFEYYYLQRWVGE